MCTSYPHGPMHTTPTHSDTAFFLGPAATEVTALLLAAAIVADACHTQQKRKPNKKETKKDVVYKFPSIRPKPFPMLRFLFCLKRVGGGGLRSSRLGLARFFGCRHWTSNAISERGKKQEKKERKQRENLIINWTAPAVSGQGKIFTRRMRCRSFN